MVTPHLDTLFTFTSYISLLSSLRRKVQVPRSDVAGNGNSLLANSVFAHYAFFIDVGSLISIRLAA